MIKTLQKILSLLPFLLAGMLGGLSSGLVVKGCSQPDRVEVKLNFNPYETEISKLRAQQDSIRTTLDSYDESLRYLSDRYAKPFTPGK